MTDETWKNHGKNFETLQAAMRDHRRVCLGRAVDRRTGNEAATICIVNFDGGNVCMIPVGVMLDDPGAFAERFTMDLGEHPARRN